MSRTIIKEFFKKKIEEGGDVDTILEWNKELCYMFPEDPHESEVVYQSKRIMELEEHLRLYKKAFVEACRLLSYSNECFNGECPMNGTMIEKLYGIEDKLCPDCGDPSVWEQFLMNKAREEE